MKPIFKYSGGKTKEISVIKNLMPDFYSRIVEPFAGSAAISFYFEKPMVLSDIRENNIRTFAAIKSTDFEKVFYYVEWLKTLDQLTLKKEYYYQRDEMFDKCVDDVDVAKRWITIRQLCFSGMDRTNNKTGKFNAPFGWYDKFACSLTVAHHNLLQDAILISDDYTMALTASSINDFIFIDPPYFERNSKYGGSYEDNKKFHIKIRDDLRTIKNDWMIVHIDCPLYRDIYKDFNINEKQFKYSQNFKGRDNTKSKVNHLYITNYNKGLESLI